MSTRAIAEVYDINNNLLVTIYKHMDGYPEGFGEDLKEICAKYTIVKGISGGDNTYKSNGVGCFAATLVKELKDGIGDVYLQTPGIGFDIEYVYKIRQVEDKIEVTWEEH